MLIRFIESPTGVFGLGYFVGNEVDMEEKRAKLLVDGGFAEVVTPIEVIKKSEAKPEPEKAEPITVAKNPVLVKQHKGKRKK
jgi:hypothetical protein